MHMFLSYDLISCIGNASGSASSNSVGMVSTKCPANVSGDEDCTIILEEVNLAS